MAEVTYVSEVECDVVVPDGILDSQVIRIVDAEGRAHVLRVAKGGLSTFGSNTYLPIGLIRVDQKTRRALIELPQEADSGTSRFWAPFGRFRRQESGG